MRRGAWEAAQRVTTFTPLPHFTGSAWQGGPNLPDPALGWVILNAGAGQPWDNHDDLEVRHRALAKECDQAIGALLKDLKQRGLLEETLVIWGGEFGRTPTVEMPKQGSNAGKINGRDHNHYDFTIWLA